MLSDSLTRKHALNPRESFIVQAPAGSGKTELLTQRYLSLLANAKHPEEILALTFTRKAAHEMRQRIIRSLNLTKEECKDSHLQTTFKLAQAVKSNAQKHNWQISENPARLQISTIDAFAASLLSRTPILSKVGNNVSIIDDAKSLYQQATTNTLKTIEQNTKWQIPLTKIVEYFDNQLLVIEDLLIAMLAKREQWLPVVIQSAKQQEIQQVIKDSIIKLQKNAIAATIKDFSKIELSSMLKLLAYSLDNQPANNTPSSDDTFDLNTWRSLANLLLTKQNSLRARFTTKEGFPSSKDKSSIAAQQKHNMHKLCEELKEKSINLTNLASLKLLPNPDLAKEQLEITLAFIAVLPLLVANLNLLFQQKKQIDFGELNIRAQAALASEHHYSDLYMMLDYKLQHLLIDEFQDTSRQHFALLRSLINEWQPHDGKTLFIVGDPMQSIYRFRQADVGLFLQCSEQGLNNIPLRLLRLTSNFRSSKKLVDWSNDVFSSGFPHTQDYHKGAVTFSPAKAVSEDSASSIELHKCIDEQNQSIEIVNVVKNLLKVHATTSIGVLARTKKQLHSITQVLQDANIDFIGTDLDNISQKPIVQDLLAITRAIHNITDKLAWLALLRGPWLGLSLADLLIISKQADIFQAIVKYTHLEISQEAKHKLAKVLEIFIYATSNAKRKPLAKLVKTVWQCLDGAATLASANELHWVNKFFELITSFEQQHKLFDVIEFTNKLNSTFITPDIDQKPRVELMTIHKAKGLEFDSVVVMGTFEQTYKTSASLLRWQDIAINDNYNGLLIAPTKGIGQDANDIYKFLTAFEKECTDLEKLRLTYVALTRAKKNLFIFAIVSENIDPATYKPSPSSLIAPFWPALKNSTEIIEHKPNSKPTIQKSAARVRRLANPDFILPSKPNEFLSKLNETLPEITDSQAKVHKIIGTVSHLCLCRLSKEPNPAVTDKLAKEIIKLLQEAGTPRSWMLKAKEIVIQVLTNTLTDPIGRWIIKHDHHSAASELAINYLQKHKTAKVIIDRTFIDKDIRWVIDYKININKQHKSMERYYQQLQKYARIMRQYEDRQIILGIYWPLAKELQQWNYVYDDK